MTSAIGAFMDFELRTLRAKERRQLEQDRIERMALRREIEAIEHLMALLKAGKLDEAASNPEEAARRRERDRQRQTRIQTTFASANRRVAALKAQRASGKPTGPLNPEKARKEAERVRKLDARAADIRASTAAKVGDIRSKIAR